MRVAGERLFTIRKLYLYLVVALGVPIAWMHGQLGPFMSETLNLLWFIVALLMACAGAGIRVVTSGYAALNTSGNGKAHAVASELNTTGPYSLVRHPLYVGRILNFTGIAMLTGSWVYGAIVFLASVLIYERIAIYEEGFLQQKFGEAHALWAKAVPGLWPRLTGWVKPKYAFWFRRSLWRENKKIFMLATALILYDFARRGFALPDNLFWYYVYGVALAVELGLRAARHFTPVFDDLA